MKTILAVFLLIPMTTGLKSYACKRRRSTGCTEHKLSCDDEDKRIHIISGYYGFKHYYVSSNYCCFKDGYDSDDCLLELDATDHSNLVYSCNGTKTCNFETPTPDFKYCSIEIDDNGRTKYFGHYTYSWHTYDYYTYSYIQYECLAVTTTLSTTKEQVTRLIYTDKSSILSTKQDNSKPAKPTESYTSEDRTERTEIILNTMSMPLSKNTRVDTAVIAGSVVGCILLVMLVIIAVVVILKRKTMQTFIDSHFKGSPRVTNPVYETPSNGYNNAIFKNDNSPSVNVVISDDYNHLHDVKNDNPMTNGNTYNHLGPMMCDYNHLPANKNSDHVNEHADGAYNHLGGSKVDKPDMDYNHLHGSKNEIPKADYDHLGENKKSEIPNDYNLIGTKTYKNLGDNYHHLGNVNEHMLHKDDYNHIVDANHGNIVEYELAHNGDLPVHEEQTRDDVQYEITDDETGDYSNISKQQSNYENVPISDHKTRG